MNTIEQLENSVAEAKLNLTKMEGQLEELKAEAAQDEEWPKVGDKYWLINGLGSTANCGWSGMDAYYTASGNAHRTKEGAEAYRDWLTNPRTQARRRVEMCDGFDPLGTGGNIYWLIKECRICVSASVQSDAYMGGLPFTTRKQAMDCINLLGEDVIKRALGIGDVK